MRKKKTGFLTLIAAVIFVGLLLPSVVQAHCDAESGPVAKAASNALETGKFDTVAIWVGEEQTEELREKFNQILEVYRMGGDARKVAENYFMETAVRLHREAEGFPYSGLKPPQPLPKDIAAAEKALETGEIQPVTELLSTAMQQEIERLFRNAREARKHREESLEAGREWADAYVRYVIYVHGLYQTIQEGPEHGVGE